MSFLYHSDKPNVVVDALSWLSMGSIAHIEDGKKELVRDVHRLSRLGVQLGHSNKGGIMVQYGLELSLVTDVKAKKGLDPILIRLKEVVLNKSIEGREKQESDPILLQLKGEVHQQRVEVFSKGGDGVLHYQSCLYVPIMGATNMYLDLWEVYWSNDMKRDIADFMAKCPSCQQVKVEHQKPGGVTQEISIPTWK
ncbi:uncharacterized protein [Solanum tuberosum]|uniref:uncharacterized protein n=1 Tax=Solanum tuberosum TaxID=4113 RepID=UPI00073A316F|nr:PREDICTED: uncharacterized protein LOC107062599 [Solanum tuberosum]